MPLPSLAPLPSPPPPPTPSTHPPAQAASSLSQLAAECTVTFAMLANDAAVEQASAWGGGEEGGGKRVAAAVSGVSFKGRLDAP